MIYMKSTSGNDGSYNLTVSFALGTDPDIDTVNVNNRVQTALAQLARGGAAAGPDGARSSRRRSCNSSSLYSDNGKQDPLFITNYATINVARRAVARAGRRPGACCSASSTTRCASGSTPQRLTSLNLAPSDIVAAIQAQNVQAPVGRIGARPIGNDQQFQLNIQTQGRLTTPGAVRQHRAARQSRRLGAARARRGAGRAGRAERGRRRPAQRRNRRSAIGLYLAPGANAVQHRCGGHRTMDRLSQRFPPGLKLCRHYDTTTFVARHDPRGADDAGEAFVLVVIVVFLFLGSLRATIIPAVAVPVSLIGTFAVLLAVGLFRQHRIAAGDGAGDRHRRRRRDRRGRERRARDGGESRICRRPRRRRRR